MEYQVARFANTIPVTPYTLAELAGDFEAAMGVTPEQFAENPRCIENVDETELQARLQERITQLAEEYEGLMGEGE